MARDGKRSGSSRMARLRREFKAQGEREGAPCWLCGEPIEYGADRRAPLAHELDHLVPVSKSPELQFDVANFRHAHRGCNRARGAGDVVVVCVCPDFVNG